MKKRAKKRSSTIRYISLTTRKYHSAPVKHHRLHFPEGLVIGIKSLRVEPQIGFSLVKLNDNLFSHQLQKKQARINLYISEPVLFLKIRSQVVGWR
jgi:hypothetical protein